MPRDTGRPRDPDVDQRIREAARAMLREEGLDALTIAGVAARAGVGRPTVYRRFATPRELAMDVFHADLDALVQPLAERDRSAPVLDQLTTIAEHLLGYYAADPALSSALLQLSMFAEGEWQERYAAQATAWLSGLALDFEHAKRDGRLHEDVDVSVLVQTFFGLYLTIAVSGSRGMFDLGEQLALLRRCLEQHLRGLVPSDGGR